MKTCNCTDINYLLVKLIAENVKMTLRHLPAINKGVTCIQIQDNKHHVYVF